MNSNMNSSPRAFAVYCAGDQARIVIELLEQLSADPDIVLFDDDESTHGETVVGYPVLGGMETLSDEHFSRKFLISHGGRPPARLTISEKLSDLGIEFATVVCESTVISESASIGVGSHVNCNSYLGPSVDVGDHVLIDSTVNLSHDTVVDDGATITPGVTIAGHVKIGKEAYIGAGATIIDGVTIGEGAIVGAGSVVIDDVESDTTVVGVPAEPLPPHRGD